MRQTFGALEATHHTEDLVALLQQQLRQIRAVLTGDARDECSLAMRSLVSSVRAPVRCRARWRCTAACHVRHVIPGEASASRSRARSSADGAPATGARSSESARSIALTQLPGNFHRQLEPRARPGVHAVVDTRRRAAAQHCAVADATSRHSSVIRRDRRTPRAAAGLERLDDAIHAALQPVVPAEQTFDAQHVVTRDVAREPLADELRRCIYAPRSRRILFAVQADRFRRRRRSRCCSAPAWRRQPRPRAPGVITAMALASRAATGSDSARSTWL